jgi:hypothetical protein
LISDIFALGIFILGLGFLSIFGVWVVNKHEKCTAFTLASELGIMRLGYSCIFLIFRTADIFLSSCTDEHGLSLVSVEEL